MSKNNKVLVAGGAGFIGSHLCDRFISDGYRVICADNFLTGNETNISHLMGNSNFEFIKQDVTTPLSIHGDIDWVLHFASPASPNHHSKISYHSLPMETMMVNTVGTKLLLELSVKKKARFMFASTSEIYGDPLEHPQKEDYRGNTSTTGPRSVYDESKRFGETLCAYYHRELGLDTRIVRIFNTYGPRLSKEDKRMSVRFMLQAMDNRPITVFGDGSQTRSLCYVDDLVEGIMRFMKKPDLQGEIINIGSVAEHTVLEYAEIIKKVTNSTSEIKLTEPLPADDPLQRKPDISKAKELLEWKPKMKLTQGLEKTVEFYRNQ